MYTVYIPTDLPYKINQMEVNIYIYIHIYVNNTVYNIYIYTHINKYIWVMFWYCFFELQLDLAMDGDETFRDDFSYYALDWV